MFLIIGNNNNNKFCCPILKIFFLYLRLRKNKIFANKLQNNAQNENILIFPVLYSRLSKEAL
jgi:hypothetical protein